SLFQRIDGALERVKLDGRLRELGEGETRELVADVRRRLGALVAGIGDDEGEHLGKAGMGGGGARGRDGADRARIAGSAEGPARWSYCHSRDSRPTSTSAPRRTPARRKASSSSSVGGGVPTTR